MKMEIIRMRTGLVWYNERDYVAARKIMVDGAAWSETFASWQEKAEALERIYQQQGREVVRAFIDPAKFPAWCKAHGRGRIDLTARTLFANYVAAGRADV